ncbi:unnamed protein product [Effrenium voratum]|nr:unnamed protein product [Effrenium voratum]
MVKKSKGALAKAKLKPEAEDDEEEEEEEEAMASEGEDMSDEEAEGEEEEDEEDDEEEGNLKVFVGNIRWSKAILRKKFEACGEIASIETPKKLAFLTFKSREALEKALKMDGDKFNGEAFKVREAMDNRKQGKEKSNGTGGERSTGNKPGKGKGKNKGKGKGKGKEKGKGKGKDKGKDKGKGKGKSGGQAGKGKVKKPAANGEVDLPSIDLRPFDAFHVFLAIPRLRKGKT